jgi:RNA polymerase sigma-70 factor (sigma-E family)
MGELPEARAPHPRMAAHSAQRPRDAKPPRLEPNPGPLLPRARDRRMVTVKVDRPAAVDRGRIGELYRQHAAAAMRLAYLLTGDRAVAEDLVQDGFVRLAGRLAHLRDAGSFDAYMRKTVVNLSHSYFRRKRVERMYLKRARVLVEPDAARTPRRSVEDREVLWTALGRLPERQRAALVLRFYEDLSEAQVAEILRCRPGTVKSLVSRGLERLRIEMRGEDR